MGTPYAETKMKEGGQIGHRILKVKTSLQACLKNHYWREKICPGGEWVKKKNVMDCAMTNVIPCESFKAINGLRKDSV